VSHGGLIKPSEHFKNKLKELEKTFSHYAKDNFEITNNLKQKLVTAAQNVELDKFVISFYFKIRIYFRVKSLNNKKICIKNQEQRFIGNSKLLKIKL